MDKTLSRRDIDQSALTLLQDVFGSIDGLQLPIDMGRIVAHCGLTVRQGDFKDKNIEGALDSERKTIFLSRNDSYVEKNFTTAHEIGHLKLHKDVKTDVFTMHQLNTLLTREGEDRREDQADLYAAALLMPEKPLKSLWKVNKDIDTLAKVFGVPRIAMEFRLKKLGLV